MRKRYLPAFVLSLGTAAVLFGLAWGMTSPDAALADESKKKKPSSKKPKPDKETKKKKLSVADFKMDDVPPDTKLEKKIQKELGESFKLKRTLHFSIFYDTSDEDVAVFGHAVERTYRSCMKYCLNLGIDVHQPEKKMASFFFNEFEGYKKYLDSMEGAGETTPNKLGVFMPTTNHTYFYNYRNTPEFKSMREQAEQKLRDAGQQMRNAKDPSQRQQIENEVKRARFLINATKSFGGGQTEETLQHEVAHQVLWNNGFHNPKEFIANPRWFAEGMAQLFEPVTDAKSGNMGVVNKSRCDVYHQIVEANRLFPLKDFIKSPRPFMRSDAGTFAYTQGWALAHYLTRVKRKELKKYVDLLNKRKKGYKSTPEEEIEAFEKCFGKLDRRWEQNWKNWMKNVRG